MTHAYALKNARASSAANPVPLTVVTNLGDSVLVLLLKATGAVVRAGGSPTFNGVAMTQASTSQIAASSPEASAEIWYVISPPVGSFTLSIPNSGTLTLKTTVVVGQSATGFSALDGANGGNATSTNPTPGAVTVSVAGDIAFAITAGGWTAWAPSAQIGTIIANTDDGADGGGEQYIINPATGSHTLSWTFGTSDDWGAVSVYFKETTQADTSNPWAINNYQSIDVASNLSTTEKIK